MQAGLRYGVGWGRGRWLGTGAGAVRTGASCLLEWVRRVPD
ncbi:hypothetical protein STTU_3035 [Streptomyces sp. Tu6071]|nr:hypothetical protein STTU_3035 [Streptomyces sp. Tu6071]